MACTAFTMTALHNTSLAAFWRASELGTTELHTRASGHAALDAQLPGAGWPQGSLTEILQAQPGLHEWRLLLPALRQAVKTGPLALIGCPHLPHLPALAALGIPAACVLMIEAHQPAERLWAAEQVLRCREVAVLMAWLPQARSEQLRRLQLASQTGSSHHSPPLVFAFRPLAARHESSPAPLRLSLSGCSRQGLEVQLLKRRGPALDAPLTVHAPLPIFAALRCGGVGAPSAQALLPTLLPSCAPIEVPDHVVDRTRYAERHRAVFLQSTGA